VLVAVSSPVCAQDRPPRPLAARDIKIPPYEIRTLANGLRVVVVSQNEQPAVSLRLLTKAGSAQDPAGKPGVAAMVGALLDQGTKTRSSEQISDAIDYVGGALGSGAGTDLSYVNVLVLKDSFDLALDLVSEMVQAPSFPQEELDRIREQALSAMSVNMQDPEFVADAVIDRLVYGFHPYGLPGNGTPDSLRDISRADLVAFHKAWFSPNNALLAVVGDVSVDEAFAGVERAFGKWAAHEPPAITATELPEPTRRVVLVDRPNAVQTEIRAGHVAIARKHPDYMPLNLATKILGGEGANRLQNVLRSEKGLTYGASADMDAFKQAGSIIAETDTQTSTTGEALRLAIDEFWRLVREPVGDRELMGAQAYLSHRDTRRDRTAGPEPAVLRPRRQGTRDLPRPRQRRHERRHPARVSAVRQAGAALHRARRRCAPGAAAAEGRGHRQRRGAAAGRRRPDQPVAAPQGRGRRAGRGTLSRACPA
jgi:zinc protease